MSIPFYVCFTKDDDDSRIVKTKTFDFTKWYRFQFVWKWFMLSNHFDWIYFQTMSRSTSWTTDNRNWSSGAHKKRMLFYSFIWSRKYEYSKSWTNLSTLYWIEKKHRIRLAFGFIFHFWQVQCIVCTEAYNIQFVYINWTKLHKFP